MTFLSIRSLKQIREKFIKKIKGWLKADVADPPAIVRLIKIPDSIFPRHK